MVSSDVLMLKNDIADQYIDQCKADLGNMKSDMFFFMSKRLREIIVQNEDIGDSLQDVAFDSFRQDMVNSFGQEKINKLYVFVKEKKNELAQKNTKEELEQLKNQVVHGNVQKKAEDTRYHSIRNGLLTASGAIPLKIAKNIEKTRQAKKFTEVIDMKSNSELMEKLSGDFAKRAQNCTNRIKKKSYLNTEKIFKEAAEADPKTAASIDKLIALKNKIPALVLKDMNLSSEAKKALMTFDESTLAAFKNTKGASFLVEKGITGLSEDAVETLRNAKNISEFQNITEIFSDAKGIAKLAKGLSSIAILDVLALGFDVWMYGENMNEAEQMSKINEIRSKFMREKANVQLRGFGIGGTAATIGSAALAGAMFGSAFPGIGTIVGLGVGAIVGVGYQLSDIYYAKVDFYSQKEEDYKRQYRTEVKQAIVSVAAAQERDLNSHIRAKVKNERGNDIETVQDARRALLWQEEFDSGTFPLTQRRYYGGMPEKDFITSLSHQDVLQYQEETKKLEAIIDQRIKYISNFMHEHKDTQQYRQFIAGLKSASGLQYVELIAADSKIYEKMKDVSDAQYILGCSSIEEYKKRYGEKLQKENRKNFAKFEEVYAKDPSYFLEIYKGAMYYESKIAYGKDDPALQGSYETMLQNIAFIKKYYEYKTLGVPLEQQKDFGIYAPQSEQSDSDLNHIEAILRDFSNIDVVPLYNQKQVKEYFIGPVFQNKIHENLEVSGSIGQNIVYRIAKEIHGYTGHNNMLDLIAFFQEEKGNALGLYYNGSRKINNDRAIDKSFDLSFLDDPTKNAETIMKDLMKTSNWNLMPGLPNLLPASAIDTPTENMDDEFNKEFRSRFAKIVQEEKSYTLPASKKTVEEEILGYIKLNSKDVSTDITMDDKGVLHKSPDSESGYLSLPCYLLIKAKKAGVGDLDHFLFKYENNQIIACTHKLYLTDKLDFSETKPVIAREYVLLPKSNLSVEMQKYIDDVDTSKKQFEQLITYDENELDIPKEYLMIYHDKFVEWETFKQSFTALIPSEAGSRLQMYHNYFENMYIAMLSVISNFKVSNDIDSPDAMQKVSSVADILSGASLMTAKDFTEKAGFSLNDLQKIVFYSLIKSQTFGGKSLMSLIASKDQTQQDEAKWIVQQLVKSICEATVLTFDAQNNIAHISSFGFNNFFTVIGTIKSSSSLEALVKTRWITNLHNKHLFPPLSLTELVVPDSNHVQIEKLNVQQDQIATYTEKIQGIIKSTQPDILYPGRGLVTYDPATELLSSRGKHTRIDAEYLTIEGLDIRFSDLKELIFVANLLNRFGCKYPGVAIFYFGSRLGLGMDYGIYRSENGLDTQIVDLDIIKEKMPSLLDSKNGIKSEFIAYLNNRSNVSELQSGIA